MHNLKLLPNIKEVFFDNVERHSELLLPLLTIDLNEVDSTLEGLVHFILPLEPFDTVGLETKKYHSYYSRCNWIAYKLKDNKCVLEPDFKFFQSEYIKAHSNFKEHFGGVDSYLNNLSESLLSEGSKIKSNYQKIKSHYSTYSAQPNKFLKYFEAFKEPYKYIEGSFPSKLSEDNIHYPLTKDGRVFRYIGSVDVTDFTFYDESRKCVSLNADFTIVLYYDPIEQVVLNTFSY